MWGSKQWEWHVNQTLFNYFTFFIGWNYFIWWYALVLYSKYYNDIFKGDNEDDNDMAVAHLSAICEEFEDLGNKSRGSYYDDKMAFVQAEGTPDNKVCILTLTVAKLKC